MDPGKPGKLGLHEKLLTTQLYFPFNFSPIKHNLTQSAFECHQPKSKVITEAN